MALQAKEYEIQYNVGKARYVVTYCTGENRHNDGSLACDIKILNNRVECNRFERELKNNGYKPRY